MSSQPGPSSASESRPRPPLNRRRDKAQLSCHLCRQRKLKCDRQRPCENCERRGRGRECAYANSGPVSAGVAQHAAAAAPRPKINLQARLSQLEDLVVSLMDDAAASRGGSLPSDPLGGSSANVNVGSAGSETIKGRSLPDGLDEAPDSSGGGSIRVSSSESRYVGSGHWASILDGIAELKEHLEAEEEQISGATSRSMLLPEDGNEMPLLYNVRAVSREEILESVPDRGTLDRYVHCYFQKLEMPVAAVHTGKFMREYENFWQSPSETPIMWLGLLYSIMCLAVISSEFSGTVVAEDVADALVDRYREKTAQCLIMGRYADGGPYTWETVYQYVVIELSSRPDVTQTVGILHGISMNLLMQMGYHRDPSHFPGISAFDGELRRRSWVKSIEGDLQMSIQTGMPRRITDGHWDTKEPRNLYDDDFDENTGQLPPGRPETEVTPVLQLIARRRMVVAVGAAVDLSTSIRPHAYAQVLAMDRRLKDAEESLPPPAKMKPLAASLTDLPQLIMNRLYLALMFRVGEVMIHRRYLQHAEHDDGGAFAYSRRACLDACLSIAQTQQTLHRETAVGGMLHSVGLKLLTLGNYAFLTACMTLCLVAHRGLRAPGNEHALARGEDVKSALAGSLGCWRRHRSSSREARVAAESVRLVLEKNGWLEEALPAGSAASQGDVFGFGGLEPFYVPGEDEFGDFPPGMFGPDMDVDVLPWFVDIEGGLSLDDGSPSIRDSTTLPG
ncbi:Fusarisetin A cluster transcription factor fsa6 [Colletotrichum orbiculare MAFF 240422]|uniref:Fusarisetin A cluster transcription factor fsa6 n=1 Tax=Colletotrichum orbiculare (strain 104-T / ATCC 96160 / CBS 514.97 / LARS 414 / MAFF 240422) TaxID=1213857 RepID=N4VBU0_COLOR|nr:Fusarisetin A cluster transcription factor fsa6 [Colletotrichum orbiculare MAFF 240422]